MEEQDLNSFEADRRAGPGAGQSGALNSFEENMTETTVQLAVDAYVSTS